ncbi:MAG: PEP-CTERM sorting domain-containing protein [Phycisphaerae bacterium]|nr:PEP-CTERM sorting domain-containing protein [Phycisphaerae bacterium]
MKRKVVFGIILGFTTFATAGLQLTVNGQAVDETTIQVDEELTIGVVNDSSTLIGSLFLLMPWGQPGEWIPSIIQPGGIIPGVINSWGWEYFEMEDVGSGWMWPGSPVIEPTPAGIMGEFGFRCTGIGDVSIQLFDEPFMEIEPLAIHQVPEPMTMSLLGLGMALIRRRRGINS